MAERAAPGARGLVIGKFMPPHAGHRYLIEAARAQVDTLAVVLFSKKHEPIPGELRLKWLREIVAEDVRILHVTEEHRVDFHDEAVWAKWIGAIRCVYPEVEGPDLVFSSEAYGEELAARLGARHVAVDPLRRVVPVSGTLVRKDPLVYWKYLGPGVRAYFVKRVCVLGAESTGKTTLAQALAEHYSTVWVPEFARGYLEARGGICREGDMVPIARGQAAAEEAGAREANRVLVCDTNLLATLVWSEHYWGRVPEEIERMGGGQKCNLYLVTAADIPWVDDGLRDAPHAREWFQRRFVEELERRGQPYLVLTGGHEKRMAKAVEATDAVMERGKKSSPQPQAPSSSSSPYGDL